MPCRFSLLALVAAGLFGFAPDRANAATADQDSPRIREARKFVRGLRERNFHELVPTYTESLRRADGLSASESVVLEFEEAFSLLDQASIQTDLPKRAALLGQARARLEQFLKDHADSPLAPEARVALARSFVERGHLAALQADDDADSAAGRTHRTEARTAYDQARTAYDQAIQSLKSTFESFPSFLPEKDPRKAERERTQYLLIDAELQRALVEYKDAQTYGAEPNAKPSAEKVKRLDLAAARFAEIARQYREAVAGLTARKMQGKCLEEKGEYGKAMGIYKELLEHPDTRLKALKQEVGYYKIIVSNRRREFVAAADAAVNWLRTNPGTQGTPERLGVMLEKGRAILSQKPGISRDQERDAIDTLNEVARYATPLKGEAVRLLAQNRPKSDKPTPIPANITYDAAIDQAEKAIRAQDWPRAIALLRAAVKAADPAKEPDKANEARYMMAYCYFQTDRYYEAAVLAEHIVRHYPKHAKAASAAEIGLAAWTYAQNNYTVGDRKADYQRALDLAEFIVKTYPDSEQEQLARLTLGQAAYQQGNYQQAAEAFEGIPSGSPRWLDAQTRAATARWRFGQKLHEDGKKTEADEQVLKSLAIFQKTLKMRQDQNTPPTDPGLLGNLADLAEVQLATDKAQDALAVLEPAVKAATASPAEGESAAPVNRLLSVLLRAHIAAGRTDAALDDMKLLEKSGGQGVSLTQLYFSLGRMLQKEIDNLKTKDDKERLEQTQLAYAKFLEALAQSKSGQSYDSLEWAGEAMLGLGQAEQAVTILEGVLEKYAQDESFLATQGADGKILRTRLMLIAARRARKEPSAFTQALEEVNALIKAHPRTLEPLVERCQIFEDWAETDPTAKRWDNAIAYWKQLATVLNKAKSPEQYEAWYHVAHGQFRKGQKTDAARTLRGILAISPKLNGPETRKKYDALLKQVSP